MAEPGVERIGRPTDNQFTKNQNTKNNDQKQFSKSASGFCQLLDLGLRKMTGYELNHIKSFHNICQLLHSPRDGSSLAVARIFYGLLMMIDTIDERSGSDLDYRWGEEKDCRFTLFPFIQPLSMPRMGILYALMFLGALGICLGYKFTVSCYMYILPYWYILLLDKSVWNNHSYLFGLTGILLTSSSASNCYSLDSYFRHKSGCESDKSNYQAKAGPPHHHLSPSAPDTVPFWNYFIIKFQYYILYTYAGVKKANGEWLSGYAMSYLGHHWVFTPFRLVLGREWTELLIIHWFGCIFDLTAAFFLTHRATRPLATIFAVSFHLMNSRLFTIGMFPWLCLFHLPLFYSVDWPRRLLSTSGQSKSDKIQSSETVILKDDSEIKSKHKRTTILLIVFYMVLQLFLPFSHFITKGYNNWTNGLYGYSWNMMVHSWDPVMTSIKVVDNVNQKVLYLDPTAFSETNRWSRHADMAKQYANCIKKNLEMSARETGNSEELEISAENISVYFDIWCAMNGRFKQRVFDPRVDILKAEWSPWVETKWVLPLLHEFTAYRPQLTEISNQVFSWSNYSDVMFIADFPGLSLDNYISNSADNVSLTILEGTVRLTYQQNSSIAPITLTRGQSIAIRKRQFHNVLVVSDKPACYMYTYTNATLEAGQIHPPSSEPDEPVLPLWDESVERWNKFILFLQHVFNSFLYELYGVPMPRRVRN